MRGAATSIRGLGTILRLARQYTRPAGWPTKHKRRTKGKLTTKRQIREIREPDYVAVLWALVRGVLRATLAPSVASASVDVSLSKDVFSATSVMVVEQGRLSGGVDHSLSYPSGLAAAQNFWHDVDHDGSIHQESTSQVDDQRASRSHAVGLAISV